MRPWGIHSLGDMISSFGIETRDASRNRWFRAVPEPYRPDIFQKIRACWWIIRGKAHAVVWPEPGDLEEALSRGKWE